MTTDNIESMPVIMASVDQPLYLGTTWISIGALKVLESNSQRGVARELRGVLHRHATGDHGDIDEKQARMILGTIHSVYDEELLVVTDTIKGTTQVTCA